MKEQLENGPRPVEKTVSSFPYAGGGGACLVRQLGEGGPFVIYFADHGKELARMESHKSLKNAETVARWMASGL